MSGKASVSHEEASVESFRRDPRFAIDYLNEVLEDGDEREIMLALRRALGMQLRVVPCNQPTSE